MLFALELFACFIEELTSEEKGVFGTLQLHLSPL